MSTPAPCKQFWWATQVSMPFGVSLLPSATCMVSRPPESCCSSTRIPLKPSNSTIFRCPFMVRPQLQIVNRTYRHVLPHSNPNQRPQGRFLSENYPFLSAQLWVRMGSAFETTQEAGLAHFVEHLAFRLGPDNEKPYATQIDSAAGKVNAYTSHLNTVFFANVLREDASLAIKSLLGYFGATAILKTMTWQKNGKSYWKSTPKSWAQLTNAITSNCSKASTTLGHMPTRLLVRLKIFPR